MITDRFLEIIEFYDRVQEPGIVFIADLEKAILVQFSLVFMSPSQKWGLPESSTMEPIFIQTVTDVAT